MKMTMINELNSEIENYLNNLALLSIVKQSNILSERITALQGKFKSKAFQLVILGQFKRGKTSLINALFGESLLPTAVVPLTSIVTVVKYDKNEKVVVRFLDGKEKQIKREELPDYITESKNPKNEKNVDLVTITQTSNYLKQGVQIIDTPGVGSVYKHNTDISYNFVPKADAGIFVVTADPPISESELQFLKSIKDYLAKIIFVQNKVDQVNKKERLESLQFTKKVIEEAIGIEDLQFIQLSARLAIEGKKENNKRKIEESGIKTLENALNKILIGKKEQVILLSVIYKLLPLINEIELQLKIMKQALQMSVDELKEKAETFNIEAERIKREREDNSYILQGQAERLTKQVLIDDIEALKEKELPQLLSEYEVFFKERRDLSGKELTKKFDKFLEKSIKNIFIGWRKEEEQKLQNVLKTVLDRFSEQTNQSIQKIIGLSSSLFDLKLNSFSVESVLADEIEFRLAFDEYNVDIDLYTPVVVKLPKFISNKLLYNKMKNDVLEQFDRHCGRSRYDFRERITKSVNEYVVAMDVALEQTISGIEKVLSKALSQKEKKEEHQNKTRAEFNQQEQRLLEIKRALGTFIDKINAI